MSRHVWLIGGTGESRAIAQGFVAEQMPCLVTVTTESALCLYPDHPNVMVQIGQLTPTEALMLCQVHQVCAVVDASHPFATVISEVANDVAKELQIPFLRYERPPVLSLPDFPTTAPLIRLDKIADLLVDEYLVNQRVFLTLGYRALPLFKPWQERSTLFARVLPRVDSLEVALKSGFTADRLIALRPPISLDLERALWQQWQISLVVAKESGLEQGEGQKQRLARELGIPLILLKRPALPHLNQTSDLSQVITFCRQALQVNHV